MLGSTVIVVMDASFDNKIESIQELNIETNFIRSEILINSSQMEYYA